LGLLLLGAVFNNTPIELRYLSFSLPFVALLLAAQGLSRPLCVMLLVQAAGVVGLLMAPATMQPARAAARAAAAVADGGGVVLPIGNDGVGIVGAFGIEAPPALPLLLAHPSDTPETLLARIGLVHRVVLVLLAQDRDSTATVPILHTAFAAPEWRCTAARADVEVCERTAERLVSASRSVHAD
ncbi:MAG TPA: hypothetical protein VE690_11345, partial [Rhodopila sp.]|nr:hypothetical protein [Rhodopila sp.]